MPYTDKVKQKEAQKRSYEANKNRTYARTVAYRKSCKKWLCEYKHGKGCLYCSENHPACLDFHHRDPSQKVDSISNMVAMVGFERVKLEVDKCDVICANCHRKKHWQDPLFITQSCSQGDLNPCSLVESQLS